PQRMPGGHDRLPIRVPLSTAWRGGQGVRLLFVASLGTLPLIAQWPSESRALWPVVVLAGWALRGPYRYLGTKKVTRRAGTSPSSPATT
ncbi:MAG: hypothetical protein ACRDJN_23745, partial [Chloroflexota bacterium]